jgi:hypothetical protein
MSIFAHYPSNWLTGDSIKPGEIVTIKEVRVEKVGHTQEPKPVIQFLEYEKAAVLNITNARCIAEHYGENEKTWKGKKLELTVEVRRFDGKKINGICMEPVAAQEAKSVAEEVGDSIPF